MGHPDYAPQFLGEEFQDIFAFAVCTAAGVATRKTRAHHSRFMVLAAVALADVGPGRIATNLVGAAPTSPLAVWATYYWGTALLLIAMLAWDLIRYRRLLRATMLGAALLWGGEAIVSALYFTPAWQAAMAGLVGASGLGLGGIGESQAVESGRWRHAERQTCFQRTGRSKSYRLHAWGLPH